MGIPSGGYPCHPPPAPEIPLPLTVRVQNFQSIRDQTVVVSGLTVITGQNNSGKTALMRAIQGVFTNAPAGALVRHGASHLTVDVDFGDGSRIRWEKGDKVNRYTVNGKVLDNVGRGVPPEVSALGLSEIKAGSDRLWPNFAQQFGGVLFLVDRPGSVTAEALSDVDKVGRLTDALRLADSDKRSTAAEMRLRRKDVADATASLAFYNGVDDLESATYEVERDLETVRARGATLSEYKTLLGRVNASRSIVDKLTPVARLQPPDTARSLDIHSRFSELRILRDRFSAASDLVTRLSFAANLPPPPDPTNAVSIADNLRSAVSLRNRVRQMRANVLCLTPLEGVELPRGFKDTARIGVELRDTVQLRARLVHARDAVSVLDEELSQRKSELSTTEREVHDLLGDHGECPICGRGFGT